ncbi:winged helix-turn-helix transcriptional regulator [Candidatus Woesearchaeota archaeon]|nr:winged helix-turn-helix transcriptional regulator [Candidatus Woesearchaeota archaeon]
MATNKHETCDHSLCLEIFANELRMNIIKQLKEGPKNVTELTETLGVERSRVSHALLELKKCHVITAKKKGRQMIYSLNAGTPISGKGSLFTLVERHIQHNCPTCSRK